VFPFEGVFLQAEMGSLGSLAESLREDRLAPSLALWVPAFCCAVRDLNRPLGGLVADGLDQVLLGLEGEVVADPQSPLTQAVMLDLHDPQTDLQSVVEWLSTPCHSGLFVSTAVIERLARNFDVPRGFGNRRRLLRALLEGSSRYGGLERVLSMLSELAGRHRSHLEATYSDSVLIHQATGPWRARLGESQELLKEAGRLFASRGSA